MWKAIALVSSGITLAAFFIAVVASVYKRQIQQKNELIKLAPENERASLIEATLKEFKVPINDLNKSDRYKLALETIRSRDSKYKVSIFTWLIVFMISAVVAVFAIYRSTSNSTEANIEQKATSVSSSTSPQLSATPTSISVQPTPVAKSILLSKKEQNEQGKKQMNPVQRADSSPPRTSQTMINSPGGIQNTGSNVTINQTPPPWKPTEEEKNKLISFLRSHSKGVIAIHTIPNNIDSADCAS